MSDKQVWAEIDLAAYRRNLAELRQMTAGGAGLMAVVKADGYGHGALRLAAVATESGAGWLGVARLEEALELRQHGIDAPTLIFGYSSPDQLDLLLENQLTQTVFSLPMAEALSKRAAQIGRRLPCHIKVDTGMGRLGVVNGENFPHRSLSEIQAMAGLPGLEVQGLFTHFATADGSDPAFAEVQLRRFRDLAETLTASGLDIPLMHAANSAALLSLPESHFDLVRPGIATYGLQPSSEWRSEIELTPVLSWKTRIIQLKEVPAGFGVSYGITYETHQPTTLATVAVGYADGLDRHLSSRGEMLLGAHRVPIVGRVCMDLTVLDVGQVPEAAVGDEVVILGSQGDQRITAEEMAATLGTINYEVVTSIAPRVPRVYVGD